MIVGPEAADTHRDVHNREEECLFFVAASRARVHLHFSRFTQQDNGATRNPSPYVEIIQPYIDNRAKGAELPLPADAPRPAPILVHWPKDWHPSDDDIRSYEGCPRRFFYTRALKLATALKPTAFSRTHDCLHELIRWMAEVRPGAEPTAEGALGEFQRIWEARGPREHAYADEYLRLAQRLVDALVRLGAGRRFREAKPLALDLPNGRVLVKPSEIAELPDGAVLVRRLRTGRRRSNEYDRLEYTLYLLAGQAHFGTACQFEAVHLADESREPIGITAKKLATRRDAANKLLSGLRGGLFAPDPDVVRCPRCPHFFICDATPHGAFTPILTMKQD
jgi:hypothetical protein